MLPILLMMSLNAMAAEGPHQPPLGHFDLPVCKAYFSAADYQDMSAVTEVPEAGAQFPGSYLFVPADGAAHPGVVWLHGSEGGRYSVLSMCYARYLAAHGYAALFFCYSDCGTDDLPETVHDVDLKRTAGALHWLRTSKYVDGKKVALTGGSRGAEQTVVLGSLLATKAAAGEAVDVPDALFAHSPYGKVVSAFNWRWGEEKDDYRWARAIKAHLACMQDSATGPYLYSDGVNAPRRLAWNDQGTDPACTPRPALAPSECWNGDTWLADRCGVTPLGGEPAWTWAGGTDEVKVGTDIPLQAFKGAVLISEGDADEVWPYAEGAKYLMDHLAKLDTPFKAETVATLDVLPQALPKAPADRVVFETFAREGHRYGSMAAILEWNLELTFLAQHL